ncbi:MAG: UDP-N-acetylmuramoyl-L-alanine--D-glutamate ligase [Spirochaetaceae bacterium]|nr:UDP-N-acetylmuramoyl-L-alanine--D-glutamate ligase [Spirochaetaceae bacterium]
MEQTEIKGLKVLIMGLGLHGGGVETARYLAGQGARITCTDLRSDADLEPSITALEGLGIQYVLGGHRKEDFDSADIIVKNPAVPSDSPWIAGRNNIETDISLFLKASASPLLAVTGSKGKSTAVTALHHILRRKHPGAHLGGNITVSPLSFVHELKSGDPVILELSSWQLADLRGRDILHPRIACITNLMHDHQNRYDSFDEYEADKTIIFENLKPDDYSVFPDDGYGGKWSKKSHGTSFLIRSSSPERTDFRGAYLDEKNRGWFISGSDSGSDREQILPEVLRVPGEPFRMNLLFASTMAKLWGCGSDMILDAASDFPGVLYRMEMFLDAADIKYYDDTTATIPEAAAAGVNAMNRPVVLIAGGTDKELDFAPFDTAAVIPKRIIMLKGSATDTWLPRLRSSGVEVDGPYDSMEAAVAAANRIAVPGDAVLLSPGATSFGMFRHEFERGDVFKAACRSLVN